jgi:outer membrane receptor protein involved in Fe transport
MRLCRLLIRALTLWALFFAIQSPHAAYAQVTTADILGTITDDSGAVLPGATVTATHVATGAVRTAVTDTEGRYQFLLLPVGAVELKVEFEGFKTAVSHVTLAIGDKVRADTKLEVGALRETVSVTVENPTLQTQTSSVAALTDERAMQDLPLNGRNFVRLAQLVPGASEGAPNAPSSGTRPDDRRQSSSVSVNGQDSSLNNFLIDGMDNNERFIGTVIVRPSVDAIHELKVETSSSSAEVGRTVGGVINLITKSGTNNYHGSLFEFFRNERLDARNFFATSGAKPEFKQNQYGGSIGGPISNNKTFFFGDYAGLRLRQAQTYTSTVPTLAMRNGDFSAVGPIFDPLSTRVDPTNPSGFVRDRFAGDVIPAGRVDPAALRLLNLYPLPTNGNSANNFVYSPTRTQTDDSFDVRIDHRASTRDLVFGRYSFNNTTTNLPDALPIVDGIAPGGLLNTAFAGESKQKAQAAQVNWNRTFSANLLFEAKAGYLRYAADTLTSNYGINAADQVGIPGINVDADSSGLPQITMPGFASLGDAGFIPLRNRNNTLRTLGSLIYVTGGHTLKVGGDYKTRRVTVVQSASARGAFAFDANFTNDPSGRTARSGNSLASFLLGYPASTTRNKYLVEPSYRLPEWSMYVQDDWRATDWLTLNLGVRYEYYSPLTEADNLIANVDLASGQIIVAGANGVSTTTNIKTDRNNIAPRLGFAATVDKRTVVRGAYGISYSPPVMGSPLALRNPPFTSLYTVVATPFAPLNRLSEGLPAAAATSVTQPTGSLTPAALDLQMPWVHQFNVTVQRELPKQMAVTASYVGVLSRDLVPQLDVNRPAPGAGAVAARRPFVSVFPNVSNIAYSFNAGSARYHAMQLSLERRFAGGFGARAGYTWAHNISEIPDPQFAFTSLPAAGGNPFPQMLDALKLETGNDNLDIRHRFTLNVNYELPFLKNASGAKGFLGRGWQINSIILLQSGVPFTVTNGTPRGNTGAADRPNQIADPELPSGDRTIARWFNTDAFAAQSQFTLGNTGRNTLRAPGVQTMDLSIFKDFVPKTGVRVQFRAEAFNILNHANFAPPNSQFGTAAFGTISSTGNNLPRNVQLALKVLF